jgi:hypothetical protein
MAEALHKLELERDTAVLVAAEAQEALQNKPEVVEAETMTEEHGGESRRFSRFIEPNLIYSPLQDHDLMLRLFIPKCKIGEQKPPSSAGRKRQSLGAKPVVSKTTQNTRASTPQEEIKKPMTANGAVTVKKKIQSTDVK